MEDDKKPQSPENDPEYEAWAKEHPEMAAAGWRPGKHPAHAKFFLFGKDQTAEQIVKALKEESE